MNFTTYTILCVLGIYSALMLTAIYAKVRKL